MFCFDLFRYCYDSFCLQELNADSRIGRPLEKQQLTLKAHAETSGSVLPQLNNLNLNNSRVQNKLQNQV